MPHSVNRITRCIKPITAFVLAAIIAVTSATIPAFAADVSIFNDIDKSRWYYPAIEYCIDNNHMNGINDTTFDPYGEVSRAQATQALYNMSGSDINFVDDIFLPKFIDVEADKWYYDSITWAARYNIVSGINVKMFYPNDAVTREQICTMFYNYWNRRESNYANLDESYINGYEDFSEISNYAKRAVNWAVQFGFMSGTSETTLDPQTHCTRAQLAQFIKNYKTTVAENTGKIVRLTQNELGYDVTEEQVSEALYFLQYDAYLDMFKNRFLYTEEEKLARSEIFYINGKISYSVNGFPYQNCMFTVARLADVLGWDCWENNTAYLDGYSSGNHYFDGIKPGDILLTYPDIDSAGFGVNDGHCVTVVDVEDGKLYVMSNGIYYDKENLYPLQYYNEPQTRYKWVRGITEQDLDACGYWFYLSCPYNQIKLPY